jgi:hypothetical protein
MIKKRVKFSEREREDTSTKPFWVSSFFLKEKNRNFDKKNIDQYI